MDHTLIIPAALVLAGAFIVALSAIEAFSMRKAVPENLRGRWGIAVTLMSLFIPGYIFFILAILQKNHIHGEIITSGVFLTGAIFVFIITSLTSRTLAQIRERNKKLIEANEELENEIGRRTKAEAQLRNASKAAGDERLKADAILNCMADGVILQDLDYRVIYENAIQQKLRGVHVGELCYEAYTKRKEICDPCPMLMSFRDGDIHKVETTVKTKGGDIHYELTSSPLKDSEGRIIGGVKLVRDITARKIAQEALAESENKFKALFNHASDSMFLLELAGESPPIIRQINQAGCTIYGYQKDELEGKPISVLLNDEAKRALPSRLATLMHGHSISFEAMHVKKNCTEFPVEASARLIEIKGKNHILAILRDITERRALEDHLRHSQKMEALGTLTGGVAHEFNNIITVIMGFSEFLQGEIEESNPNRKYVDMILSSSERAARLTDSLLSYSRKQHVRLEPMDLNMAIDQVRNLLGELIGVKIKLLIRKHEEPLVINADRSQIEQVIMNMSSNAIEEMPEGGALSITTGLSEIDGLGESGSGKYATITISDTGRGMDAKTQERIFEPFFTTKEVGKGTGLGLAVVYGIIKKHEGHIKVQSAPGAGTTFTIYLPLTGHKAPEANAETRSAMPGGNGVALVAEDDDSVRQLIAKMMQRAGFEVIEAKDGVEAVDLYMKNINDISLLLLDISMPGKSGTHVLREARLVNPDAKAIFISGHITEEITDRINDANALFITKPVRQSELYRKVASLLES